MAASLLPLGKDTLVYGSADGGETIRAMNSQINAKIDLVAEKLNLYGEHIWNNRKTEKGWLSLSCDIEGHMGKDKRFYLVDTARLMPPATPKPGVKGSFLIWQVCLLAETVDSLSFGLSWSDQTKHR